ncbi:protein SLFN14-like isoform X2 [Colossoma macropomum]|uniref:protein SLFN14-like isoform X2 n=1 Tax=Colossoma macropomum TaxID=42526 RepID=UPI0018651AD6|nr:protein SLFN14-like isoform X2 [Colossoma macropomum]
MPSEEHVTLEKARKLKSTLVLRIEETTFGEEARKKMDNNRRRKQSEVFLKFICALLNSGGGVLCAKIANKKYIYDRDALGEDLEKGLNELLNPEPIQDFIQITQNKNELRFYVRSWCSAERQARLCCLNTGLMRRSATSALPIAPTHVVDHFLKRRKQDQDAGEDPIHDKACQFYEEGTARLNQTLDFGESATVELKRFDSEKKLIQRLQETLPKYLSAFANTAGGFLFIGINDKTKTVVGCGKGMTASELEEKTREICNKAQSRALHMHQCPKRNSWSPEIKVFPVTTPAEDPKYIIAIKIPAFCCAVFAEDPKCWQIEGNEVIQLKCSDWLEKMQRPVPDDLLTGPASGHNEKKNPNTHPTFTNPMTSGIITSQSCADDITKAAPIQTLMITPGEYLQLFFVVQRESAGLWKYARETAFNLTQKLVNLRGYTGRICVIPHLVCCVTGEVIQNETVGQPLYPKSYTLDSNKKITALLYSLATTILSSTSQLEGTLRSEFIKVVFGFILLGSGKTLLVKKETDCEPDSDLSVCENEALKVLLRKHRLCICEIIFDLTKDPTGDNLLMFASSLQQPYRLYQPMHGAKKDNLLTGSASVHNKFSNKYPNIRATNLTLMITPGEYLQLFFVVPRESAGLWKYARETAFNLTQKLVNPGGYTGRICVIPRLVCCVTGEVMQNETVGQPLYLQSYTLDSNKKTKSVAVFLSHYDPQFHLTTGGNASIRVH